MCGRYAMSIGAGNITSAIENYDLKVNDIRDKEKENASYNIGPTKYAPTYRTTKENETIVQYMSWGLIPFWTKKKADANQYRTFNARKESVISGQRLWAPVRKHSRCVVPVEGYYEWQHKQKGQSKKDIDKIPYFLKRKDNKLMFLAGLYDTVNFDDTDGTFQSFTIITGPAPKQTKWLHERMPIVLTPGTKEWDMWLDNNVEWNDSLASCLTEYAKDDLEWYEVSRDVGKIQNDGEYLIKPLKKGEIGDFFGKGKKDQIKGEAQDFKPKKVLQGEAKGEEEKKPDIIEMVKGQKSNKIKEEYNDEKEVNKKVKKVVKKEDDKEKNKDQNTRTKRTSNDQDVSHRLRQEDKKPKVGS